MKKFFKNTLIIMFVLWMSLCYFEIITKNVRPNPEYSRYNIIVNTINYFANK